MANNINYMDDIGNKLMYQWKSTGNNEFFGELYTLYYRDVYRFLRSKGNNDFESNDLTQDAFINLYTSKSEFKASSKFSTYIFMIANNRAKAVYNTQHRIKRMANSDTYHNMPTEHIDNTEIVEPKNTNLILSKISSFHQTLLKMSYLEHKTNKNIAIKTGISETQVSRKIKDAESAFKEEHDKALVSESLDKTKNALRYINHYPPSVKYPYDRFKVIITGSKNNKRFNATLPDYDTLEKAIIARDVKLKEFGVK